MKFIKTLLFLLTIFTGSYAQQTYSISGIVKDSITNQSLGFVTILINAPSTLGTTSNSLGKFSFTNSTAITSATFSFIGYVSKKVIIDPKAENSNLEIFLKTNNYSINNVVITLGENPANRIVRNVIENRDQNDPDKLSSYQYTAYNKFIYSGVPPVNPKTRKDSTINSLYNYLDDHYFLILESVVETDFAKPDQKKERVIGTKISGLQDPSFTLMNTQIQPLSFYGNFIYLLSNEFINPFAKGSTERYFFTILDTLYNNNDTIYKMSFRPWKGRNFEGLRGIVEINTDGYAIQNIISEPADSVKSLLKIQIEQHYEKVNNERWFPTKFVSVVKFNNMLNDGFEVIMHGTTSLTNVVFNPLIKNKDLQGVQVEMLPDAGFKKSEFWNQYRADSLTIREKETYHFLDSIGKKRGLDTKLRFAEGLLDGELRYKFFNFYISRFLWLNDIDGIRPGIGLHTNDRVSRIFSVGGFASYGFNDERWKLGGEAKIVLSQKNNIALKGIYQKDLEESGAINFYKDQDIVSSELLRSFLINSFDFVKRTQINLSGRSLQYLLFDIGVFNTQKFITTTYRFVLKGNNEFEERNNYGMSGFKIGVRYAYKEKMVQALHNTFLVGSEYPVLFGQVTRGFKNILDGEINYTKYEAKIKYNFKTKAIGEIYFQIAAGYIDGDLPVSDLFAGRGNYQIIGLYSANSFQTMRLNEFYSDKYVALFYQQDLETLLYRGKKFQPKPLLVFNATIGSLGNKTLHRYNNFKTLEKGFYETGIIISNLINKQYLGVARIELGLGAFYRLNYNDGLNQIDRFAFKVQFGLTF
jgi:hypothetical protein